MYESLVVAWKNDPVEWIPVKKAIMQPVISRCRHEHFALRYSALQMDNDVFLQDTVIFERLVSGSEEMKATDSRSSKDQIAKRPVVGAVAETARHYGNQMTAWLQRQQC